jgi:ABC-type nickel/cobalt efflux system permease component RcnA
MAKSSLGIGTNEVSVQPGGMFAGFFLWINTEQRAFYKAMTVALKGMRDDGNAAWLLIGLSFAYGIFHAAGPGHGKAVISSYMLANESTLKRGIFLSFVASALQALSAAFIVGAAFLLLRGTSWSMDDATQGFEIASFALITGFGAWLLWSKIFRTAKASRTRECPPARPGLKYKGRTVTAQQVCANCGNSHAPDPGLLSGDFNLKTAWSAVLAVGLRPCSGALIVLTFAMLNGLYFGGIVSVFAMALGTAITVSALAILAVMAKDLALRYAKPSAADTVMRGIEITGAAMVFLFGLLLLGASLAA